MDVLQCGTLGVRLAAFFEKCTESGATDGSAGALDSRARSAIKAIRQTYRDRLQQKAVEKHGSGS